MRITRSIIEAFVMSSFLSKASKVLLGFIIGFIIGTLLFLSLGCIARRPPIRPPAPIVLKSGYKIVFGDGSQDPKLYKDGKEITDIVLVIDSEGPNLSQQKVEK